MQVVSPEFVGAKAECLNFLIDYTDACLAAQQAENEHQGHRIKRAMPEFLGNQLSADNLHDMKNMFAAHITEHEPQGRRTIEQYDDSGAYQRDASQKNSSTVARAPPLDTQTNAGSWED